MPTPPSATPQTTWHDPRAEHLRGLSWSRRWLYALKPASWPKLLVPMLLGQLAGFATSGSFHAAAFVAGALFSVLLLVFIVLLNDWRL